MTTQDTMRLALEALEEAITYTSSPSWSPSMTNECKTAIEALKAALSQPPKFTNDLVEFIADALTVDKDHARALMIQALSQQGEQQPVENPYYPATHIGEGWQDGFDGKPMRLSLDAYKRGYAEGRAKQHTAPAAQPTCKQDLQVPTVKENLTVEEPKQPELFCGVDVDGGIVSVTVLRRRPNDVAEVIHSEQIELAAPAAQPLSDKRINEMLNESLLAGADHSLKAWARRVEREHGIGVQK